MASDSHDGSAYVVIDAHPPSNDDEKLTSTNENTVPDQSGARKLSIDARSVQPFKTFEQQFDERTRLHAVRVDGRFKGWIEQKVALKLNLPSSRAEFQKSLDVTLKNTETSEAWRDLKITGYNRLAVDPNTFFFNNTGDGLIATGEWRSDEIALFLRIAEIYGCGDNWGLFSTHIPNRVGYQCARMYKIYFLKNGLIHDPNHVFALTTGHPIYLLTD